MACSSCAKAAARRQARALERQATTVADPQAPKHYQVTLPDGTIEMYGTPIPARRRAETTGGTWGLVGETVSAPTP